MTGEPDPTTEELRIAQRERETTEQELAEEATLDEEEKLHAARADRAAYLREKLEEQQAADADRDDAA